jgi:hypothetical protein
MNNLEEIRDEVIRKGFPELMAEDVQIEYKPLKDAILKCDDFIEEGHYVEVDPRLQKVPREILTGGVAHEFAHLVDAKKRNKESKVMDLFFYRISKTYRTAIERDADLVAIMRGFGPELLAFLKYAEKQDEHYKENGLNAREVEAILLARRP